MFDLSKLFGQKNNLEIDVDNFVIDSFNEKSAKISLETGVALKNKYPDRVYLLDVRTPDQYAMAHVKGAGLLQAETMFAGIPAKYDKKNLFVVYCNTGSSSGLAQEILESKGYKVLNAGGMMFYQGEIVEGK